MKYSDRGATGNFELKRISKGKSDQLRGGVPRGRIWGKHHYWQRDRDSGNYCSVAQSFAHRRATVCAKDGWTLVV